MPSALGDFVTGRDYSPSARDPGWGELQSPQKHLPAGGVFYFTALRLEASFGAAVK
jgi:hypothetical protein